MVHVFVTVIRIIKLNKFPVPVRLRSGSVKLKFSRNFTMFKNVVQNLEPGETPSNSASHRAPNYTTFLKIAKHFKTVAVRLRFGCG